MAETLKLTPSESVTVREDRRTTGVSPTRSRTDSRISAAPSFTTRAQTAAASPNAELMAILATNCAFGGLLPTARPYRATA
jgi:hypothetical protein